MLCLGVGRGVGLLGPGDWPSVRGWGGSAKSAYLGQRAAGLHQLHHGAQLNEHRSPQNGEEVWQSGTRWALVQPHHATLHCVTSGAIASLSEPDYNKSAPSPDLE